jgi:hypothetical protein
VTTFDTVLNNVATTLGAAYTEGSSSLTLAAGYGATILARIAAEGQSAIGGGNPLRVTVATSDNVFTVFKATGLSGDVLTVTVVEGTDRDYASGTACQCRLTTTQFRAHEAAIQSLETTAAGLGTASTHAVSDFDPAGAAAAVNSSLTTALALKAPLASPVFTSTPRAPTATLGTNTTQLATTAFVLANAGGGGGGSGTVGLGTDVWGLSGDPESETDWGPIINDAYTGGTRHFLFQPHAFPFSTTLNFDGSVGVVLQGSNGLIWPGDSHASDLAPAYLLWKGTGTTTPISAISATGFNLRGMGVYYDNSGFTGTILTLGASGFVSQTALIENSVIRSTPATMYTTARAAITLNHSIVSTVRNCVLGYGSYGIIGIENTFSNANRVVNNTFDHCTVAMIGNTGNQWVIESNTFEMSGASGPAVLACIGAQGGSFTFSNNWVGDYTVLAVPFVLSYGSQWDCTFSGNSIGITGAGPIWHLGGGGIINIINNPVLVNGDVAIVDMVDGSPFKELTWFGNVSSCTGATEAILSPTGHALNVRGSDQASMLGIYDFQRFRARYPARYRPQTIVKGAALGTGASAASLYGGDSVGQIILETGTSPTAGVLATVTFGTPMINPPNSPFAQPLVFLTHYGASGAVDAGLYVSSNSSTGFVISCLRALTGNAYIHFFIIWM